MMNSTASFYQVQTTFLSPARNSSSSRSDNEFATFLEKYYSLFLLIFGTVGNLLCLAVLSREIFRRSSAGIYLRFLTLSDLAAIYTGVLFFTARALFNNNFRKTDELSCKFHRWLSFTACDLSSWALVLVSTARLLSIAWPMKRLITRRRVYASILVTVVVLLGANLPIFIIYGDVRDPLRNRTSLCVFTQDSYEDFYIYVFSWLVLVKFGFLPGVLLIVLNAALVLSVSRSGRAVDQITSQKQHPEASSGPAANSFKMRLSTRKRKLEANYSGKDNSEFENSELSTGSEFSDGTVSTSDGSELEVSKRHGSHRVGAWTKLCVFLQPKSWHHSTVFRLRESSLFELFSGIKMLWPGDERQSHKDLACLSEDVASLGQGEETATSETKESNVQHKETLVSLFGEVVKSGPENLNDSTNTKIPAADTATAETRTYMADVLDVKERYCSLNNTNAHVNLLTATCSATDENSSGRAAGQLSTDHMHLGCENEDPSQYRNPCSYHSSGHDKNMQQEQDLSTTIQPTTDTHTIFSGNNTCASTENSVSFNNTSQTETGRLVLDNRLSKVTDIACRSLLEIDISVKTEKGTDKAGNSEGCATSADDNIHTNHETRTSLGDIHMSIETHTNQSQISTNPDSGMSVAISKEIHNDSECVNIQNTCPHNCVSVNNHQRHAHPNWHNDLVCGCIMSQRRGSLRDVRTHRSSIPVSISCDSCPHGSSLEGTDSTVNSRPSYKTQSESIPAPGCTSQNHRNRPNTATNNDCSQMNEFIEPAVGCGASQVNELRETSAVCIDSQDNKLVDTPEVCGVSQLTKFTELDGVCGVNQVNEMTEPHRVCGVSQVTQSTETSKVSARMCSRRKSGGPRKVANKSRSLTRTLLVLNTVFLVCNTPITVYLTGKTYFWPNSEVYNDSQEITVTVANFSMYTSNSINFILYCVTGSRFRGQLVLMFKELYHLLRDCARRLSRVCKERI